jgi:hypothetical protein
MTADELQGILKQTRSPVRARNICFAVFQRCWLLTRDTLPLFGRCRRTLPASWRVSRRPPLRAGVATYLLGHAGSQAAARKRERAAEEPPHATAAKAARA